MALIDNQDYTNDLAELARRIAEGDTSRRLMEQFQAGMTGLVGDVLKSQEIDPNDLREGVRITDGRLRGEYRIQFDRQDLIAMAKDINSAKQNGATAKDAIREAITPKSLVDRDIINEPMAPEVRDELVKPDSPSANPPLPGEPEVVQDTSASVAAPSRPTYTYDASVEQAQAYLYILGNELAVDGKLGPETKGQIESYAASNNITLNPDMPLIGQILPHLKQDVLGREHIDEIKQQVDSIIEQGNNGASVSAIKAAQHTLNAWGENEGVTTNSLATDGAVGPLTRGYHQEVIDKRFRPVAAEQQAESPVAAATAEGPSLRVIDEDALKDAAEAVERAGGSIPDGGILMMHREGFFDGYHTPMLIMADDAGNMIVEQVTADTDLSNATIDPDVLKNIGREIQIDEQRARMSRHFNHHSRQHGDLDTEAKTTLGRLEFNDIQRDENGNVTGATLNQEELKIDDEFETVRVTTADGQSVYVSADALERASDRMGREFRRSSDDSVRARGREFDSLEDLTEQVREGGGDTGLKDHFSQQAAGSAAVVDFANGQTITIPQQMIQQILDRIKPEDIQPVQPQVDMAAAAP